MPLQKTISKHLWSLFLFSAFIILILLPLFQKGTFIDGVLYKTVAFNSSQQSGNFWTMKYTDTCMPVFCEQPPLYPWLLGVFYKLFGNHYLVDRFFTLFLFSVLCFLLKGIIVQLFKQSKLWFLLTVFFVFSVPVICWSYVNQVIEPLVCVFIAAGVLFFIRYLRSGKAVFLLLFAISIYLCFITKGFQSCFLIVLPVAYFFLTKFSRRAFVVTSFAGLFLILAGWITLKLYQAAADWFECYYQARLVLTMQNVGNTTESHSEILVRFFTELIIPLACLLILFVWLKMKRNYPVRIAFRNFYENKLAMALLITSLAGSFPYALSLVQRGFYLNPAFICFILALVIGFRRYWLLPGRALSRIGAFASVRASILVIFAGTVIYFCLTVNGYKREEKLLTDLEMMYPLLPKNDTVAVEDEMWNYFNLHSYLYMERQVSLLTLTTEKRNYLITKKSSENIPQEYQKLPLPTSELDLWVLIESPVYLSIR